MTKANNNKVDSNNLDSIEDVPRDNFNLTGDSKAFDINDTEEDGMTAATPKIAVRKDN